MILSFLKHLGTHCVLRPVAGAWWLLLVARFYICRFLFSTKTFVISEKINDVPINHAEALYLSGEYIRKHGNGWVLPLAHEISEAVKGREKAFNHFIWALDAGRSWIQFRPSDGATKGPYDFFISNVENAAPCDAYLIRTVYL